MMATPEERRMALAATHLDIPVQDVEQFARKWAEDREQPSDHARQQAAWHVLWWRGHSAGVQPGRFIELLLLAWGQADTENAARLRAVYPVYAQAFFIFQTEGAEALAAWGTQRTTQPKES